MIENQETITDNHSTIPFPCSAFFSAIPDEDFIITIRELMHGIGHGFDDVTCLFPSDLNPGDKPFQGVEFWVYANDEAIVDLTTFMTYVRLACAHYLLKHPQDESILQAILANADLSDSQTMRGVQ